MLIQLTLMKSSSTSPAAGPMLPLLYWETTLRKALSISLKSVDGVRFLTRGSKCFSFRHVRRDWQVE